MTVSGWEWANRARKALRYVDAIDGMFADVLEGMPRDKQAELLLIAMTSWKPQCWEILRKQIPNERDVPSALTIIEIRRIYERRVIKRTSPRPIVGAALGSK